MWYIPILSHNGLVVELVRQFYETNGYVEPCHISVFDGTTVLDGEGHGS